MANTNRQIEPKTGIVSIYMQKLMEEERKKQLTANRECANEYGYPICFVNRDCDQATKQKYELGKQEWPKRNEKGTLANKKYRRAKCWEYCAARKVGNESPDFIIQKQMTDMRCNEFIKKPIYQGKLGIGPKIIIGGLILYILLKK